MKLFGGLWIFELGFSVFELLFCLTRHTKCCSEISFWQKKRIEGKEGEKKWESWKEI
jgi:hypothetical protein